jgi:hypothetical protein
MAKLLIQIVILSGTILLGVSDAKSTKHGKPQLGADPVISELLREIQSSQVKVNQPDYHPPLGWSKIKGSWPSEARFNFHGNPAFALIRDDAYAFDNDAFVTGWLMQMLLETVRYANPVADATKELTKMTDDALHALNEYRDHNFANGSGLLGFFKQKYNASANLWYAFPDNLNGLLEFGNETIPWNAVIDILKQMHDEKDIQTIKFVIEMIGNTLYAFHLPSDFDDSFLNLGLGATLKALQSKNILPSAFTTWQDNNAQITNLLDAAKKYAYRPFSSNTDENLIDPRSYFFLHTFIADSAKRGEPLALITTWAQNLSELKKEAAGGVHMPFNLNNVDLAVCANTVAGIVNAVLEEVSEPEKWFDDDLKNLLLNTSSIISHVIDSGLITQRPDIIILYYPSLFTFYWFVGRTVFSIENALQAGKTVPAELKLVHDMLSNSLKSAATEDILSKVHHSGFGVYFDDFLGNNDTDIFGGRVNNARDRLYTTSMAVNALIRAWTFYDEKTGHLFYKKDVPTKVLTVLFEATTFLRRFILTREYSLMNDFFSGSYKGLDTLNLWYPANYKKFANGTDIPEDDSGYDSDLFYATVGVSGVIDEATYTDMVYNQEHFGRKTPLNMTSYNAPNNFFPFWSSASLTQASALQALSFVENLLPVIPKSEQ